MNYYYTDEEIKTLLEKDKSFSGTIEEMMNFSESDGHKRASIELPDGDGNHFIIKLRQNTNVINDFSAIFSFRKKGYTNDFKLKRYNGKSHEHSNKLEGEKFYDFHIHSATQRYQDIEKKEESYSEITDLYTNLRGALKCLIEDCNVKTTPNPQANLFDE